MPRASGAWATALASAPGWLVLVRCAEAGMAPRAPCRSRMFAKTHEESRPLIPRDLAFSVGWRWRAHCFAARVNGFSTGRSGRARRNEGPCHERCDVPMLRIQRSEQGEGVRFMLSGRIEAEYLSELRRLIEGEERRRPLTLDLGEVKLVDRDAVTFLAQCEAAGATLENCPVYVREWIARERADSKNPRRKTPTRRNPER